MDREKKYIQPKFPLIPLTAPEKQLDAVLDFCTAWNGPIELAYEGKYMMLLPFEYYLGICTPEEAREIQEAIDRANRETDG